MWTPVVNCSRDDLQLKAEIYCHLIDDCNLTLDDMFFFNELIALKRPIEEIAIIDHNVIDTVQAEQMGEGTHSKVTYIYDHHFDNKAYPAAQLKDNQTRFIGSACSILVLEMKNGDVIDRELLTSGFARYMAAAIVLDTVNFNPTLKDTKWQQEDMDARDWLAQYCTLDDAYFNKM